MTTGNELFGKLKRAVVVRAIGDDRRQTVSVMIGAHEHVARRLAGGIGRVRRVRRRLGEKPGRAKRTINFVGRDVMKFLVRQIRAPESAARFEQIERADDVRGNEIARPGNGTVHMRFRREVHDVRDGVLFDDAAASPPCRANPPSRKHISDAWKRSQGSPDARRKSGNPD